MKKIYILLGITLVVLICIYYLFGTIKVFRNSRQIFYSRDRKMILVISVEPPIMSFGSVNKVLRLYSNSYILLGKCKYGEHPLKISDWNDGVIEIDIDLHYDDRKGTIDYVKNWIKKNKKIGQNEDEYETFMQSIKTYNNINGYPSGKSIPDIVPSIKKYPTNIRGEIMIRFECLRSKRVLNDIKKYEPIIKDAAKKIM